MLKRIDEDIRAAIARKDRVFFKIEPTSFKSSAIAAVVAALQSQNAAVIGMFNEPYPDAQELIAQVDWQLPS